MGKDLVPRFKCPLCGWLAYYSMFERGPYKFEIKGMKYDGFQEISYHRVWTGKKEYKEYLRIKVRELAKKLGLKLADEEEAIDEYEEEEMEAESSEEIRAEKPSNRAGISAERVDSIPAEYVDRVPRHRTEKKVYKEFLAAYVKATEKGHVTLLDTNSFATTIDHEFVELGGDEQWQR